MESVANMSITAYARCFAIILVLTVWGALYYMVLLIKA